MQTLRSAVLLRYENASSSVYHMLAGVKTTRYFDLRIKDRPEVRREWCERVLAGPEKVEQQDDGKYQMWGYIAEAKKYLRVITLEDKQTVDNAFFDRSYGRKSPRS